MALVRLRRALLVLLAAAAMTVPTPPAAADPLVVVTVGTSIEGGTFLQLGQSWPSQLSVRVGYQIFDRSMPGGAYTHPNAEGDTIRAHVDAAVAELHPDILILGGPVNDLVSLDVTQVGDLNLAIYNAADAAYKAGVKHVIVMGILPFSDGGAFQAGWWPALESRRQVYNQWAAQMWGGLYVDLSWALRETTTQRGDARWFRDGLHPTRVGASIIAETFPVELLTVY